MDDTERLFEKLSRIEALFAGATTDGERVAAATAMERILARLGEARRRDPPREYRFTFDSGWSHKLFVALVRRYGLSPYRYYRQRYTTVMVQVPQGFLNETLWPEYEALNEALCAHLDAVTSSIIEQAVSPDTSEPEVRAELPGGQLPFES